VSAAGVEQETLRRLQPLARCLPSNPRQIKRILNGIALYQAAALQHPTFKTDGDRWFQLALWIVLMTEWPTTWRLLAACPQIVDFLGDKDPASRVSELQPAMLPGSPQATLRALEQIRLNENLMTLINPTPGRLRAGPGLNSTVIQELLDLTPLYSRPARLPDIALPTQPIGAQA
jgi:hypothetical protein